MGTFPTCYSGSSESGSWPGQWAKKMKSLPKKASGCYQQGFTILPSSLRTPWENVCTSAFRSSGIADEEDYLMSQYTHVLSGPLTFDSDQDCKSISIPEMSNNQTILIN